MKWREQRTLTASTLVTANRIQQTSVHSRKNSRWRARGGEGGKMPEIDRYIRALWAQSIYSYKSSFCAHSLSLSLSLLEVTEVAIKHRLRSEHWHTVSHSDTFQSCLGDRDWLTGKKMKRSAMTDGTCQLLLTTKITRTWTRTRTLLLWRGHKNRYQRSLLMITLSSLSHALLSSNQPNHQPEKSTIEKAEKQNKASQKHTKTTTHPLHIWLIDFRQQQQPKRANCKCKVHTLRR